MECVYCELRVEFSNTFPVNHSTLHGWEGQLPFSYLGGPGSIVGQSKLELWRTKCHFPSTSVPPSVLFHQCCIPIFIFILLVPDRMGALKKHCCFVNRRRRALDKKTSSVYCSYILPNGSATQRSYFGDPPPTQSICQAFPRHFALPCQLLQ
jgi:hypothetical protein